MSSDSKPQAERFGKISAGCGRTAAVLKASRSKIRNSMANATRQVRCLAPSLRLVSDPAAVQIPLKSHTELAVNGIMSGKPHRAFWLVASLIVGILPLGSRAALSPEKLYQKALPSVMSLEVENQKGEKFVGSAVVALADDVAFTTWHLVADARTVSAVFADGQRAKVIGCIDHDSGRDVALLKLEKKLPHRQAVLCQQMQPIASRVYVIGTPKGYDFSISDGLISQIRSVDGFSQYQVSCPISPGNSGSPIFNQRGEVIGLAAWTKADAQNVNFAIPVREFTQLTVSKPPETWNQLAASAKPPSPPAATQVRQPVLPTAADGVPVGDYLAFIKRLSKSAGEPMTIIVLEEGQTNLYRFALKSPSEN